MECYSLLHYYSGIHIGYVQILQSWFVTPVQQSAAVWDTYGDPAANISFCKHTVCVHRFYCISVSSEKCMFTPKPASSITLGLTLSLVAQSNLFDRLPQNSVQAFLYVEESFYWPTAQSLGPYLWVLISLQLLGGFAIQYNILKLYSQCKNSEDVIVNNYQKC